MRRTLLLIGCVLPLYVQALPPPPLDAAVTASRAQSQHWAYTESTEYSDGKGKTTGVTVLRFDPSLPFAEQYKPITVQGHAPTAKELRRYRELGEKRAKLLTENEEKETADGRPPPVRIELGFARAIIDFDTAVLVSDENGLLSYRVPLRGDEPRGTLFEKLELTVTVDKSRLVFVSAHLRLLSPMRIKLIARLKEGELTLRWRPVDPQYPPLMTEEEGDLRASILFVHLNGWEKSHRSDFKRVTPYSDRFGVKIGPLRALSF